VQYLITENIGQINNDIFGLNFLDAEPRVAVTEDRQMAPMSARKVARSLVQLCITGSDV
jgi:hypothetical protein